MKDELKSQFEDVFAEHGRKVEQLRQVKVAKESAEEQFIRAFRESCTSVIKPAFEHIGAYLATKGLKSAIAESQDQPGRDGRQETREQISLRVQLDDDDGRGYRAAHEIPQLSLIPEKYKQEITIHQSTISRSRGGMSGAVGTVRLEQVTEELLEQKVLNFVRELLK
jgi:hypothetical protein